MSDMVKIAVTYDMVVMGNHQEGRIELAVPKRLAGILVYDRHCFDNSVAKADIFRIITGVAHLQGYESATISNIRYANSSRTA
jgi:hypothetical protein